ncbi:hypothetical protein CYMTET_41539 [Cymbomonas tetramitiformis]|uniref:Tetratricopeptide repeat protein 33 n=1 Tax=Cymbomonas tetramitiformis TaxID=36881 RepID=A0AAE0F2J4_9CHLO|nr:hypothetical protein CYMTET_41539 [Cymbomonas tetramitiformis]
MQFGWNRKRRKLRDKAGLPFESAGGSVSLEEDGTPNLFSLTSGANYVPSEEALKQSLEIQAEGNTQAENGLFREALKRWERALDLTPERAVLHELKAQVLLEMDAVWQAVRSAKKATEFDPEWSERDDWKRCLERQYALRHAARGTTGSWSRVNMPACALGRLEAPSPSQYAFLQALTTGSARPESICLCLRRGDDWKRRLGVNMPLAGAGITVPLAPESICLCCGA